MGKRNVATVAVNLRLPKDLYDNVVKCANDGYFSSIPDFIRETLRNRVTKRIDTINSERKKIGEKIEKNDKL